MNSWYGLVAPANTPAAILDKIKQAIEEADVSVPARISIVTLGLFLLVINALMLMLTGWIADGDDVFFSIPGANNTADVVARLVVPLVAPSPLGASEI